MRKRRGSSHFQRRSERRSCWMDDFMRARSVVARGRLPRRRAVWRRHLGLVRQSRRAGARWSWRVRRAMTSSACPMNTFACSLLARSLQASFCSSIGEERKGARRRRMERWWIIIVCVGPLGVCGVGQWGAGRYDWMEASFPILTGQPS